MNEIGLGVTLKKLCKEQGEWVLEVERMVPLGNFMHQPVPQKISGQKLIGRHLRAVPELMGMADATEQLMLDEEALESYEIWEGSWVDEEMIHSLSFASTNADGATGNGVSDTAASHRAMAKVQRMQESMAQRLSSLELGNIADIASKFDEMNKVLASISERLQVLEGKQGLPQSTGPAEQSAGAVPADTEPQPSASTDAKEEAPEVAAPSEEEEPVKPEKRMRTPKPVSMRQSISTLFGEEIGLTAREAHVDFNEGIYYRVTVIDDVGILVGVMVADLEATVRLSSQLLMLPDGERDSQLESEELSTDTVDTMSEIFNTMSATINNVKNNPHVKVEPMALMAPDEFPWTGTTKRRVDVDVTGGGILSICAI